jgi:hypothetical protein
MILYAEKDILRSIDVTGQYLNIAARSGDLPYGRSNAPLHIFLHSNYRIVA